MLPSQVKVLAAICAVTQLFLVPGSAQARFGKRSTPSTGNTEGEHSASTVDSDGSHSADPSHEHSAEPVQSCQQDTCIREERRPVPPPPVHPGPVVVYIPPPAEPVPPENDPNFSGPPPAPIPEDALTPPPAVMASQPSRSELSTTLAAQAQGYPGGATIGLQLGVEGTRWGAYAQATGIVFKGGGGLFSDETIGLINGYVTYALLADPRLRLRIEAGITGAFATDLTVIGPGIGASGLLKVIGPFQLEGAIHGTPFPYRQLDWNAGVGLDFGVIGVHGGWRKIILDDRGLVDGVINRDDFSGPFLGLAITF